MEKWGHVCRFHVATEKLASPEFVCVSLEDNFLKLACPQGHFETVFAKIWKYFTPHSAPSDQKAYSTNGKIYTVLVSEISDRFHFPGLLEKEILKFDYFRTLLPPRKPCLHRYRRGVDAFPW